VQDGYVVTADDRKLYMAYEILAVWMTFIDLQVYSNRIYHTLVQQLTRFQLTLNVV